MNRLYEDDYFLAVAKPAGMVVHPTYRNKIGTLLNALTSPTLPRPSIVGRLDKWTSGIVLVAKHAAIHAALQRILSSREAEKIYLAVVAGEVAESLGAIDFPLKVNPADRRRVVAAGDGSRSFTRFERLAILDCGRDAMSLLRCRPATGRRHQIRVHLAARGWPLLGDRVYGADRSFDCEDPAIKTAVAQLSGQALHSWRLTFPHPVTGSRIQVEAPITGTMAALLSLFSQRLQVSNLKS